MGVGNFWRILTQREVYGHIQLYTSVMNLSRWMVVLFYSIHSVSILRLSIKPGVLFENWKLLQICVDFILFSIDLMH